MQAGDRFGIIRFGSRTDLYLPEGVRPLVVGGPDDDRWRNGDRRAAAIAVAETTAAPRPGDAAPARPRVCGGCGSARARPRFKGPSFNRMIPNLMTLLGPVRGPDRMRFALGGPVRQLPSWRSPWPACIDGLDGRLARLLKATSRFGAEFDSLADFLCFGVAPAVHPVSVVAASAAAAIGFVAVPDVRGLHGAAAGAVQRRRWMARRSRPMPTISSPASRRRPGRGWRCSRCSSGWKAQSLGLDVAAGCRAVSAVRARWCWSGPPCCWSPPCRSGASRTSRCRREYVLPLLLGTGAFAALLVADPWAALAAARADLSGHAAVQRAQLPPAQARGGSDAGRFRRGSLTMAAKSGKRLIQGIPPIALLVAGGAWA